MTNNALVIEETLGSQSSLYSLVVAIMGYRGDRPTYWRQSLLVGFLDEGCPIAA